MAKFLSQVYTTIRGSVGGLTYSANQYAPLMVRARTTPVNPQTVQQTAIRSAFSGAAQMWKNATDNIRDGWNSYASTCFFQGPLGQYTVSGRSIFLGNLSTAIYLKSRGLAIGVISDIFPLLTGFIDVQDVKPGTIAGPGTGIAVNYTYTHPDQIVFYSKRSFGHDASRQRFKGPYLTSTLIGDVVAPPASGFLEWTGLEAGQAYFTESRCISDEAPFRMSARFPLRHVGETVGP